MLELGAAPGSLGEVGTLTEEIKGGKVEKKEKKRMALEKK